jgi:hypothetical protein
MNPKANVVNEITVVEADVETNVVEDLEETKVEPLLLPIILLHESFSDWHTGSHDSGVVRNPK